jgi:hypothetical protein
MSASLKQKLPPVTPAAFQSAQRAELAVEIVASAAADTRKAALARAVATADDEVRAARRAVEAAETALQEAQGNATQHRVATALGTAGPPPLSVRECRALAVVAADDLQAGLEARDALKVELNAEQGRPDFARMRVKDAAIAVIKAEMAERAVALAAEVERLQKDLVSKGSALQWLSEAGATVPMCGSSYSALTEAEKGIRDTIARLDVAPNQWATGTIRYATSVFEPTGRLKWEAAFEALKTDPNAALP